MTPNERAALLALVKFAMDRGHSDACRIAKLEAGYQWCPCRCGFDEMAEATLDLRTEEYNA